MKSQFTIPHKAIEDYVKNNFDAIVERMSIDYDVETEMLETLSGDRNYELIAVMQVELKVPVSHLAEVEES